MEEEEGAMMDGQQELLEQMEGGGRALSKTW